ncbi:MAG: polyprenyl synthetase family protein, partial [Gemmataceae bacterium]
ALEQIHRHKTGALFRSALRLGVYAYSAETACEIRPEIVQFADRFADAFGLLFQVTDDLLDVESDAAKAGKRVGKDADRGKLTYPGLLGVAETRRRVDELVNEAVQAAGAFHPTDHRLARLAKFVATRDR